MGRFQIAVFPGDGIGHEVMAPTLALLKKLEAGIGGFQLDFQSYEAGAGLYQRTGVALPEEAMAAAARADAILLGAMGLPNVRYPDGTEVQPHLDMREKFALYAGIRPVRIMAGAPTPLRDQRAADVDCVLVRESTEGLFASRSMTRREGDAVFDTMKISRAVSERLFDAAFKLAARRAASRGRKPRVTCVDKANVIPSLAYFRTLFLEAAKKHPEIEADCIYVDATALRLVRSPWGRGHIKRIVSALLASGPLDSDRIDIPDLPSLMRFSAAGPPGYAPDQATPKVQPSVRARAGVRPGGRHHFSSAAIARRPAAAISTSVS